MLGLRVDHDLELVLLEERHVDALHALVDANRAHLARWLPWAATETRDETAAFVRASLRRLAQGDGFDLGILHAGRLVGCVGLHGIHPVNRSTTVGYWLAADAQGRGIATRAVRALVQECFGPMGLHRVEIRVAPDNARSLAIARWLGFTEEGTLRQVERMGEGWLDLVVLSCLAHEWRG